MRSARFRSRALYGAAGLFLLAALILAKGKIGSSPASLDQELSRENGLTLSLFKKGESRVRESRSLDELLVCVQDLFGNPEIDVHLFFLSREPQAFCDELDKKEVIALLHYFLDLRPRNFDALTDGVTVRLGELHKAEGVELIYGYLEEDEASSDKWEQVEKFNSSEMIFLFNKITPRFLKMVYLGWAKHESRLAWAHFKAHEQTAFLEVPFGAGVDSAIIYHLSGVDPQFAFQEILHRKGEKGDAWRISEYVRGLPAGMDWLKVQSELAEGGWEVSAHVQRGISLNSPSFPLFNVLATRWMKDDFDTGYQWAEEGYGGLKLIGDLFGETLRNLATSAALENPVGFSDWLENRAKNGNSQELADLLKVGLYKRCADQQRQADFFFKNGQFIENQDVRFDFVKLAVASRTNVSTVELHQLWVKPQIEPASARRLLPVFQLDRSQVEIIENLLLERERLDSNSGD